MTLLDYHRLRAEEAKTWPTLEISPAFRERVDAALADPPALCSLYRAASADERGFVRSRIDNALANKLMSYARGAPMGEALVAHAIANLANGDVRDVLVNLQSRHVWDYPQELREAAAIAGPALSAVFLDLVQRDR